MNAITMNITGEDIKGVGRVLAVVPAAKTSRVEVRRQGANNRWDIHTRNIVAWLIASHGGKVRVHPITPYGLVVLTEDDSLSLPGDFLHEWTD